MKATALLHQDHEKVNQLFQEFEQSPAKNKKKEIFEAIKTELELHSQVEEEIFYPAVRQAKGGGGNTEDLIIEGMQEHQGIDFMIEEISEMSPDDELYVVKVAELKDAVVHHVEEEETKVFQEAQRYFSNEVLEELGNEMQQRKQSIQAEGIDELR